MMDRKKFYREIHDEMETADTLEIRCLHDLCHESVFANEAGPEFVHAVDDVFEERGCEE